MSESKTSENRLSAAERQLKAVTMRKAGFTFEVIADRLGYAGPSGAYQAVMTALRKTLQEPSDELRKLELERYDSWLVALGPGIAKGNPRSIEIALRVSDRRAALLGLDAPKKIEVSVEQLAAKIAAERGLEPAAVLAEAELILRGDA